MPLAYPKILTDKDWQKHKGLAKVQKTGLGELLKALEKAFSDVDQARLTAGGHGKLHDHAEIDAALADAKAYYKKEVLPLIKLSKDVHAQAKKVQADFAKSKVVPKKVTAHVAEIAKAADHFSVALKGFDDEFKTFGQAHEKIDKHIALSKDKIGKDLDTFGKGLAKAAADIEKDPTTAKETWNKNCHQQARSICNGLKVVPEWNPHFEWFEVWGDSFHEKTFKKHGKDPAKFQKAMSEGVEQATKDLAKLRKALA